MTDVLEKRVADLETLVWEIPNLLNVRFARFETAIADNTSRTAALEKVMVGLQSDVRDLRGGVTRQLVEQDRRLSAMEQKLADQDRHLGEMGAKLADQDRHLGEMGAKLADQDRHLGEMGAKLADQDRHLGEMDQKLDQILRLLTRA